MPAQHESLSVLFPGQSAPPCCGAGLSQSRNLVFTPFPQVREQFQADQDPHSPSTSKKKRINTCIFVLLNRFNNTIVLCFYELNNLTGAWCGDCTGPSLRPTPYAVYAVVSRGGVRASPRTAARARPRVTRQ